MAKQNALRSIRRMTAVINASAAGVIETARQYKEKIAVYAGRHGIIGALTEDLIDTSEESAATIARSSTARGARPARRSDRLKSVEESRAQYARLVEVFKAHSIGYFFTTGGDSATLVSRSRRCRHNSATLSSRFMCRKQWTTISNHRLLPALARSQNMWRPAFARRPSMWPRWRRPTRVFILEVMGRHAAGSRQLAGSPPRRRAMRPMSCCSQRLLLMKSNFSPESRRR